VAANSFSSVLKKPETASVEKVGLFRYLSHRRRSGWTSGEDAWRAPKVGPCRVGWDMGRGVPSPAD